MAPEPESQASEPVFPDGLHARGRSLWTALGQSVDTAAGQLAVEICRSADRLDELDSIIAGDGVLRLMRFRVRDVEWDGDGDQHLHVEVGFQSVLAEARQQQSAFKAMLVDLAKVDGLAAPAVLKPAAPSSPLDQLAQRRAQGA